MSFDAVYIADLRFPGGTSTALINELDAAVQAGVSVAVLAMQSSALSVRRPPNGGVVAALARLGIPVIPPDTAVAATVTLIYHPTLLNTLPTRLLALRSGRVAMVAHHPLRDAVGAAQFDYPALCRISAHMLGQPPVVLPVGPKVRDSFVQAGHGADLAADDWHNLIDPASWPVVACSGRADRVCIGRHSRPDPLKWPDCEAALSAYPPGPGFGYAMLGVDGAIRDAMAPWPGHWQGLPFAPGATRRFLAGLDVWAYFHHPSWIEAFGYGILEALVSGLPVVLAPDFRPLFGDAALYVAPQEAGALYDALRRDPGRRAAQGARGRAEVQARFGYGTFGPRFDALSRGAARAVRPVRSRIVPRRALRLMAITSNGVGAGHIVRQLAIAKAAGVGVDTTFFSLSKSVRFAADAGYAAEYRAFHRQTGSGVEAWNAWLCDELMEALAFYRPDGVIFDGNMPYAGMLRAVQSHPEIARIWVRRAMWRAPNGDAARRADLFHLVITPGELCGAADPGHGAADDPMAQEVPPILPLPPGERFARVTARRLLDLPQDVPLCLLHLGAGSNYDMQVARDMALSAVLARPDAHIVELVSPARLDRVERLGARHHLRTVFPAFVYSAAFDFAVGAAGYNSFHEAVAGALPTLFVPNAAEEMDLQETRATYAARAGWALAARADDVFALQDGLSRIVADAALRDIMRRAMQGVAQDWVGADHAARLIALTAQSVPLARPVVAT